MGSEIIGACLLISIFVMGPFALIAWATLSSAIALDEDLMLNQEAFISTSNETVQRSSLQARANPSADRLTL